jgi:hypothetical protein
MGGIAGRGTEFPSFAVRSYLRLCRLQQTAGGILFADVRAAFYSMPLEVIFGRILTDASRRPVLLRAGLTEEQIDNFVSKYIVGVPVAQQWGLHPAWCAALADWHAGCWFTVRDAEGRVFTLIGSRPGDPAADLAFCLGFLCLQLELFERLTVHQIMPKLVHRGHAVFPTEAVSGELPFVFPTFMDDLAIPLRADTAPALLDAVQIAASVLVETGRGYGLSINFAAGKTEAVIWVAGEDTAMVRDRLASPECLQADGASILPLPLLGEGYAVRIVPAYKHLGVRVSPVGPLAQELASRGGSAKAACAALGKSFFRKRKILMTMRVQVAAACVHSRLLHQAGTWGQLSKRQWASLSAAYYRPYRMISGVTGAPLPGCGRVSNVAVHQFLRVLPLEWTLVVLRLRAAARISLKAPMYLVALLQSVAGAEWQQVIVLSCRALQRMLGQRLGDMPDPTLDP